MIRYALVLGLGVYIGYSLAPKSTPQPPEQAQEPAHHEKQKPAIEHLGLRHAQVIAVERKVDQVIPRAVQKKVEGRIITLTTSAIAEMEENWNSLNHDIRLKREDDGWRIIELNRNSLFAKAGFMQGDLITQKAVESLRYQESGLIDNLPERFSKILSSVTNY